MIEIKALIVITLQLLLMIVNGGEVHDGSQWIQSKAINDVNGGGVSIDTSYNENTEIFISIASYRDSRCPKTIQTIFKTAKHPNRVKIGLVAQLHTEEDRERCLFAYCKLMGANYMYRDLDTENVDKNTNTIDNYHKCPYLSNIRTIEMTHQEARGPEYGRHLQDFLLRDEEFCFQIDSHISLLPNWDVDLISMWMKTNNEYAVLSTYPPQASSQYKAGEFPHVCTATFTKSGLVRNLLPTKAKGFDKPLLAPFYSSQFAFSKCHAMKNVPSDSNLMYLVDGTDYLYYARLWTRGYDVYSPNFLVALHDNTNNINLDLVVGNPKIVDKQNGKDSFGWLSRGMDPEFIRDEFEKSLWRYYTILGSVDGQKTVSSIANIGEYGLGNKRSLDQLISFTGMDTRSKNILGMRCANLEKVPYKANNYPGVIDSDVWGYAAENINANSIPLLSGENIEIYKSLSNKNVQQNNIVHTYNSNSGSGGSNSGSSNSYSYSGGYSKNGKLLLLLLPLLSMPLLAILRYFKISII